MTAFARNRYDSDEFTRGLESSSIERDGNDICVTFEISNPENEDMTIYFPGCTLELPSSLILRARDVCSHISELDNLVQQSCEEEWRQNGLASDDYELYLAHIDVEAEIVRLEYYGTKVNTQWEARFRQTEDGNWAKVNF